MDLSAYVLSAMMVWVPINQHYPEPTVETQARYESIAKDIALVSEDPEEPVLFKGQGIESSAILLASFARFESAFSKWVDSGDCNKMEPLSKNQGNCDSKLAFTLWQIHTNNGLLFDGTGWRGIQRLEDAELKIWSGPQLLSHRLTAAKMALHMLRQSYKERGSACGYTGESCRKDQHPKAVLRVKTAAEWVRTHPFKPTASD